MRNSGKFLLTFIIIIFTFIIFSGGIFASGSGTVRDVPLDIDNSIGLEQIKIPFFPQISLPNEEYATIFSWLSFGGALFSIGFIIFWIILIIRASAQMLRSQGNDDAMAESFKKLKSVFVGAGITVAFPILISIIGGFMGLGPLWNWPAALRDCPNDPRFNYYFQAVIHVADGSDPDPKATANRMCFGV
jgi:hypothetical protein